MEKKTLEQIDKEIADLERQRASLFSAHQEKKKMLASKKTEQEKALIAGQDTSQLVTEILETQVEIQGLLRTIKLLDENLEQIRKTRSIEFQWVALAQAEKAGSDAVDTLKSAYEALVEFVERNSRAMVKAKELEAILKKLKRPTPMTDLSRRLTGLFYDFEKQLPLLLERFPNEMFKDGNLPKPKELKKKLMRNPANYPPFGRD